jgi:hypothetical protein
MIKSEYRKKDMFRLDETGPEKILVCINLTILTQIPVLQAESIFHP